MGTPCSLLRRGGGGGGGGGGGWPLLCGEHSLPFVPQIYTTRAGKDVLEAQRVNKCKPCFISVLLIAFFISRAIYNFVALGVNKMEPYIATDMVNVIMSGGIQASFSCTCMYAHLYSQAPPPPPPRSSIYHLYTYLHGHLLILKQKPGCVVLLCVFPLQADNEFKSHFGYIDYFVVQVVWEVIPTYLIVFFFRVTFPSSSTVSHMMCVLWSCDVCTVSHVSVYCESCDVCSVSHVTCTVSHDVCTVSHVMCVL